MKGAAFSAISQASRATVSSIFPGTLDASCHRARMVCTITSSGVTPSVLLKASATARVRTVVALTLRPAPGRAPPFFGRARFFPTNHPTFGDSVPSLATLKSSGLSRMPSEV